MIEFKDNTGKSHLPQFEIIKWKVDGEGHRYCYTVAVFRYNKSEPCWYLETIGDRIVGLDPVEFMAAVKAGFEYLESKERCLACGRRYDD